MKSFLIQVSGIVQGVGFRPFVYNLAIKHNIKGWVNNDDRGVNILLNCEEQEAQNFIKEFQEKPPKLAIIHNIKIEKITN